LAGGNILIGSILMGNILMGNILMGNILMGNILVGNPYSTIPVLHCSILFSKNSILII
jgi:hypothetical protein